MLDQMSMSEFPFSSSIVLTCTIFYFISSAYLNRHGCTWEFSARILLPFFPPFDTDETVKGRFLVQSSHMNVCSTLRLMSFILCRVFLLLNYKLK